MKDTLLYFDPLFLEHDPGPGHPECRQRLDRTLALLERAPVEGVVRRTPRAATAKELAIHSPEHQGRIRVAHGQSVQLDPDTATSPQSSQAALFAAGAAVAAVEEVMAGRAPNAFGLVRPPGHHAEPGRAMGFCLFNNIAAGAEAARRAGAERVMILDWDVHHGNGTQACFWERRDVLYLSSHQYPFYPGTGAPGEIGAGLGKGFTVNCALPAGRTDADYGAVFHDLFLPIGRAFRPDILLVSAGFDPHQKDPLGQMRVTERGFAAMCSAAVRLAEEVCGGKAVLLLEGGYNWDALAHSVHACLKVLTGERHDFPQGVAPATAAALKTSRAALAPYWPSALSS